MIDDIKVECTFQVVTNNDANMKKIGMMHMKLKSKILWSACEAHCIDFMLEIVAQGNVMQQVIGRVKKVANFFYQSYRLVALMK